MSSEASQTGAPPTDETGTDEMGAGDTETDSPDTESPDTESPDTESPVTEEEASDPEELHNLVIEHGDAVYRLAVSVVRDRPLAEDIAQEALLKAWLALPSLRNQTSLRSWILRIAHNTAISALRSRRAVVIDPHELPEPASDPSRSIESQVQSGAVMDDFVEALETLDDLSRSIVVLRELEGLSYDEIADVLKVPLPTVKTRLLRARRRLGSTLREWE